MVLITTNLKIVNMMTNINTQINHEANVLSRVAWNTYANYQFENRINKEMININL